MKNRLSMIFNFSRLLFALLLLSTGIAAQSSADSESSGGILWYIIALVAAVAFAGAVYILVKGRRARVREADAKKKQEDRRVAKNAPQFRRKRAEHVNRRKTDFEALPDNILPQIDAIVEKTPTVPPKPKFSQLSVSSFTELKPAAAFEPLPDSDDEKLIDAIYQTQEDAEENEEVRESAVTIMAAFKNRNSVDALAQIAQYDISADLRAKAVMTLAEFDHESVFESILLAFADPARSVRAAAARGLFMLSFERGEAFMRIAETNDAFRMGQAARAAVEADFVGRSFDRLVHADKKIAYEAFALLVLLVKASETKQIFEALRNHPDENVKMALLQVVKAASQESALPELHYLSEQNFFSGETAKMLEEVIESLEPVHA